VQKEDEALEGNDDGSFALHHGQEPIMPFICMPVIVYSTMLDVLIRKTAADGM
jgi:hypothetical protein